MSGEQNRRPTQDEQLREVRQQLFELSRRLDSDDDGDGVFLNDLADVRTDALGDDPITLADGDVLTYRASDQMWIPGTPSGGGSGFPITHDSGIDTATIDVDSFGQQWLVLTYGPDDGSAGGQLALVDPGTGTHSAEVSLEADANFGGDDAFATLQMDASTTTGSGSPPTRASAVITALTPTKGNAVYTALQVAPDGLVSVGLSVGTPGGLNPHLWIQQYASLVNPPNPANGVFLFVNSSGQLCARKPTGGALVIV